MSRFEYVQANKLVPSQDFVKGDTLLMLSEAYDTANAAKIPPPPIVVQDSNSARKIVLDGHNLVVTKALRGERCLVFVINETSHELVDIPGVRFSTDRKESVDSILLGYQKVVENISQRGINSISDLITYNHETVRESGFKILSTEEQSGHIETPPSNRGFIVGRFQPFHIQHLEYTLEALHKCEHLIVGITKALPIASTQSLGPSHRGSAEDNLLTYYERVELITRCLDDIGVPRSRYRCTPMPLDESTQMDYFIPNSVRCYSTVSSSWNYDKKKELESYGYDVKFVIDRIEGCLGEPIITSSFIRESIRSGSNNWETVLPIAGLQYLKEIDYKHRLIVESSERA